MTDPHDWDSLIGELFGAIDVQDVDRFLACIAPDARFRFGSASAVVGHEAIAEAVRGFFGTIAGLEHTITNTLAAGSKLMCEGSVTYTRTDRSRISLPFVNVFEFEQGLISDYRIYIDIAPLYGE